MAGVNSHQVYLPGPDQSATTGAIARGPLGTALPTDARSALDPAFVSGGYVSENGVTLSTSRSTTPIKDWALSTVRKAVADFDGTIGLEFLQVDQFAAEAMLGAANVEAAAATREAGNTIALKLGPTTTDPEAWVFSMKDGERRVRIVVPNGNAELSGDVTFVPGAANIWPATLNCYDDGTGHSIYVYYDDGQVTA